MTEGAIRIKVGYECDRFARAHHEKTVTMPVRQRP